MNSTQHLNDSVGPSEGDWIYQIIAAEGAIGVLGNLLVCFVILRVKFLHNMTNYLLVNLAVADMLSCLIAFTFYFASFLKYNPASFGGRLLYCRLLISDFLPWAVIYASAYNLCLVTLERYVAIVHPLQYARKLTAKRMTTLIALVWTMSFLISIPFIFDIEPAKESETACSEITYPNHAFPILLSVLSFFMGYLLPITLMSWAYYKIQVNLKRQAKALNLQHARAAAYDLVIARQRLVSMLTIVLGALIILWTVCYIAILLCLHPTDKGPFPFCGSESYRYIREISNIPFYLNSAINPIIYEFKYKKFRQGLRVTLCGCFKRHDSNRIEVEVLPL
ncbi:neuromedin-U receptor 2-like [Patiria miniata]|uniref:G-protein coupled receptors family 1 profile domain-containing protein n=1 Tax=Patiria miniata TaxID=46514 RepID=A0A914ATP1_PATMI|nr:neuromedin-U receptor 2-like [Patiria miniata]